MLLATTVAMRQVLAQVKEDGTPINVLPSVLPFGAFLDLIGVTAVLELEQRFAETHTTPTGEEQRR